MRYEGEADWQELFAYGNARPYVRLSFKLICCVIWLVRCFLSRVDTDI